MKKFLIVLIALFLASCGSKTITYEQKREYYNDLEKEIRTTVSQTETFTAGDYIDSLDRISKDLELLKAGLSDDDDDIAESLFYQAVKLDEVAGLFSDVHADKIKSLASAVRELIVAAYDKTSVFSALKKGVADQIEAIKSWDAEDWQNIEKRKKISWAEVEAEYEQLAQDTIDNLPKPKNVSEAELEEYKDTIINNYEKIKDGVTDVTKANADVIYEAAIALHEYTCEMNNISADKVNKFALGAIDYVKRAYGENIPDEYHFLSSVEAARKWTLSLWNELTMLMKQH